MRDKLAHEIASGISYMHAFTHSPIIHGDLKLQNILVGDNFNAKVQSVSNSEDALVKYAYLLKNCNINSLIS